MKRIIEKYKKIKQMPKGNAYLFFGFYFFFFLFVFGIIFLSPKTENVPVEKEDEESSYVELGGIENINYQFQYTVLQDGVEKSYKGIRNKDQEQFTFQSRNYYYDGNLYYMKGSNDWVETNSPYLYENFRDIILLSSFFKESYLESETVYKSGKKAYRFFLDTNTIYDALYDQMTDYSDEGNSVVLYVVDNHVDSIAFQLDGFCKSVTSCQKSLKIEMSFERIGEIEEIQSPISLGY